jgi:hypothetical protein
LPGEVVTREGHGFKGPIMVESVKVGSPSKETTVNARAKPEF